MSEEAKKQGNHADIAMRLRSMAGQIPGTEDCYEAADFIEAQAARIEKLEKAILRVCHPNLWLDYNEAWNEAMSLIDSKKD